MSCRQKPSSTMAYCTTEREVICKPLPFITPDLPSGTTWVLIDKNESYSICVTVLQCLTPVLLKENYRFRWADSSHSFRWAKTQKILLLTSLLKMTNHWLCLLLSFDRNCPVLCQDVMKWWWTLSISWLLSTTATSKRHQLEQVKLNEISILHREQVMQTAVLLQILPACTFYMVMPN